MNEDEVNEIFDEINRKIDDETVENLELVSWIPEQLRKIKINFSEDIVQDLLAFHGRESLKDSMKSFKALQEAYGSGFQKRMFENR